MGEIYQNRDVSIVVGGAGGAGGVVATTLIQMAFISFIFLKMWGPSIHSFL